MDDILINKNQTVKAVLKGLMRNIAVHEYQKLNLEIVQAIIENEIEEIKDFSQKMIQKMVENN